MQCSLFDPPKQEVAPSVANEVVKSAIQLRSTQPLAISMAREHLLAGRNRVIVCAPCGFGKSVIASKYVENALKKKRKVWFIVDRQNLVNQMSKELLKFGIEHGVLMAGHERWWPDCNAQVASVQTLEKRGWDSDLDLILIDEVHALMRKSVIAFLERSPKTTAIGFTATPFNPKLSKVFQVIVNPTTTNKQIEEGNLVPLQIFSCVEADMKGAKTSGGEWTDGEVASRGSKIVGDIVSTWTVKTAEVFGGPVKTIVNAASIAHGAEICEAFAKAGFKFVQLSCNDEADEKSAVIEDFKRPDTDIDGLVSVGVLSRGFNVTDVQCGIDARPLRKAFDDFIQKIGRVQRAHKWEDGRRKEFGLWLDHAGNVGRFLKEMQELFENGVDCLPDPNNVKPPRKEPTKKEKKEIFCPRCKKLWEGRNDTCSCGYKRKRMSTIETVPGQMVEVVLNGKKLAENRFDLYRQLCTVTRDKGYKSGWAANKFKEITGKWPDWKFEKTPPAERVTREVQNKLRSMQIAFAHGKKKAGKAEPGLGL
jgi:DNA repair protein RadD